MSRWRRSASRALTASGLGLVAVLLGSAGCEFISGADRSDVEVNTGGTGNGGSSAECSSPSDCPGTDTVCRIRTCFQALCGFSDAPAGTVTDNQQAGDCVREICDGKGVVTVEPDDADILDDQNDCTTDICVAGTPKNVLKGAGATCGSNGGNVCDGAGSCVECVGPQHCPTTVCVAQTCVPAACVDMVKNGSETDVD
ncbi:MAG TPA: hypothetical protein PK156_30145, partial [Polyangium sp.]|nr:hypothetical protein [Polyangium sp.]